MKIIRPNKKDYRIRKKGQEIPRAFEISEYPEGVILDDSHGAERALAARSSENYSGSALSPRIQADGPGGYARSPQRIVGKQNADARFLDLRLVPATPAAEAIAADLAEQVLIALTEGRQRKPSATYRLAVQQAVGTIAGSVLRAWAEDPPTATYRSRDVNAIEADGLAWRPFLRSLDTLVSLGLLRHRAGSRDRAKGTGWAARYWPSDELLRLAEAHGVCRDDMRAAFKRRPWSVNSARAPKIRTPVTLTAIRDSRMQRRGPLPVDYADPEVAKLVADVEAQNAMAAEVRVQGCPPPRWYRPFIGSFALGGRFIVPGQGYQAMPPDARLREIRIAGEAVIEVDIRSCLLSIMHGLVRLPLPEGDLYNISLPDGSTVPRNVAKACINATLGKGSPVRKWAKQTLRKCSEVAAHNARAVMAAVLARYPFMAAPTVVAGGYANLGRLERVLPHLLMGIEARIMADVLAGSRANGILGLPLHDGIIVPASAEVMTCGLIREAGVRYAAVEFQLKVERAGSGSSSMS